MPEFSTERVTGSSDPLQLSLNQSMLRNHRINKQINIYIIQGMTFDMLFSQDNRVRKKCCIETNYIYFSVIFGSQYLQLNCNETFHCLKKTLLLREMLKEIVDLKNFDLILITAKCDFFLPQAMQNLFSLGEMGQHEAAAK